MGRDADVMDRKVYSEALGAFRSRFGTDPVAAAYAPGRIEVLGNHTDYNEGLVLSAAVQLGTFFLAAPADDRTCRVVAANLETETEFGLERLESRGDPDWSAYVRGVTAGLQGEGRFDRGFLGLCLGDLPLGAGLSSSAALEVAAGLALGALYGVGPGRMALARIGQAAEHHYAGVRCGLLDQISSLFGEKDRLVLTDFRSMHVRTVPFGGAGEDACFLMCDTRAEHSLGTSAYNERRAACEAARDFFAGVLEHPVRALRDVDREAWRRHAAGMDPVAAKRAGHVIGENERVRAGRACLEAGRLADFGKLMWASHESSRSQFENSCAELDAVVDEAARIPGVLGARLSGGGFGGSAVALLHRRDLEHVRQALGTAFERRFGHRPDMRTVLPSAGACRVEV